jgi:hypothetical protein
MTNEDREEVKGLIAQETKKEVRAVLRKWRKWLIAIGAAFGVVNAAAVWSLWTEVRSKARQAAEHAGQDAAKKEIQRQKASFEGIGKAAEAGISTITEASRQFIAELVHSSGTAEQALGGLDRIEQNLSKKLSDMDKLSQELRPKLDAMQGPGADKALTLISQLNELKTDDAKSVLDAIINVQQRFDALRADTSIFGKKIRLVSNVDGSTALHDGGDVREPQGLRHVDLVKTSTDLAREGWVIEPWP